MEWDSIAIIGFAPTRVLKLFALVSAIAASSSAVGSWFRPQSANRNVPCSPYSQLGTSRIKKPDTSFTPGAVFKICSAGRRVSAVAWHAPATIPSASFAFTMITPKVMLSVSRIWRAFSGVIPLCFLVSYNNWTYSSSFSHFVGSITRTPVRSTSSHPAPSMIFSSLPTIIMLAIPSSIIWDAAISVLLSFVSGSTIVFLSDLAFSLMMSI